MLVEIYGARARTLLVVMLLLFIIGIWDIVVTACYMGSLVRLLAVGEGLDRVLISFFIHRKMVPSLFLMGYMLILIL